MAKVRSAREGWRTETRIAVILGLLLASGCHRKFCKDVALDGLSVVVVDRYGTPLCDVTIEIRDGAYMEALTFTPDYCSFSGVSERPGTYTVRAHRDGITLATETVIVPPGECHVKHTDLTLIVR